MLTTPQAAKRLGVSTARIRQLILEGRLPSQQFGRDHLIKESDLALVANRPTGRPKKADEAEAIEATRASAPVQSKAKKASNGATGSKPARKSTKGAKR